MNDLIKKLRAFVPGARKSVAVSDPTRDWLRLLLAFLLLLSASVAWNIWFFGRVAADDPASAQGGGLLGTYSSGSLHQLLDARSTSEEAYRSVYRFVDPSR